MGFKPSLMFRWTFEIIVLVALIHIESSFAESRVDGNGGETAAEKLMEKERETTDYTGATREYWTTGTMDSGADTAASGWVSALVIISVLIAASAAAIPV